MKNNGRTRLPMIVFCVFFLPLAVYPQAGTDTTLFSRMTTAWSYATDFSRSVSFNPAVAPFSERPSLSGLSVEGVNRKGDAGWRQLGTGGRSFALQAGSFMHKLQHTIWGDASYRKGNKREVRGNESSDFLLVYPYVMTDSLGGDHALEYEEYAFSGGYSKEFDAFTLGTEVSYRALMEYGRRDPRPDNICSDLLFKAGALYKLSNRYALGAGLRLRKYKQKNELKFYNPLGSVMVYHSTGLGMNAFLFAGNRTETRYDGGSYGVVIQFLPTNGNGFSASMVYDRFSFDKILPSYQNLTISRIAEDVFQADLSWKNKRRSHTVGVKGELSYMNRGGTEDLFHLPQYGNYVKIAEEELYHNKVLSAKLSFFYEKTSHSSFTWQLLPYLSVFSMDETYKSPTRRMKAMQWKAGPESRLSLQANRSLYQLQLGMGYRRTVDSELLLTDMQDSFVSRILQDNFHYLSSDGFSYAVSFRWNYSLSPRLLVYLKTAWDYQNFDKLYSNHLLLELGFLF